MVNSIQTACRLRQIKTIRNPQDVNPRIEKDWTPASMLILIAPFWLEPRVRFAPVESGRIIPTTEKGIGSPFNEKVAQI
jgi:hypothetical protein